MKIIDTKTIEYFEGPILEQVTDEHGQIYARKWASNGTFILAKTTTARIKAYKDKRINMLDLLVEFNDQVWVEKTKKDEYTLTAVKDLPPSYLPQPEAMYDEDLSLDQDCCGGCNDDR